LRNNSGKDASEISVTPVEEPKPEHKFREMWSQFIGNMWALWEFCQQISPLADRYSETELLLQAQNLARIFEQDMSSIEPKLREYLENLPNSDEALDYRNDPVFQEARSNLEDMVHWLWENHPDRFYKLQDWWRQFIENPPVKGPILRQGGLILAVGYLDLLFDHLVKAALPGSDIRKIRVKILKLLEEDKPSVLDELNEQCREIIARRNVMAHYGGVAEHIYITATNQPKDIEGRLLNVSVNYLERAIENIFLFGVMTAQYRWRKQQPHQQSVADNALGEFSYATLLHKKYHMAIRLVKMGHQITIDPKTWNKILVNQAIAYRELGDRTNLELVLSELNRNKPNRLIKIAIAVLYRQDKRVRSLIETYVNKPQKEELQPEWVLFDPYRERNWFMPLFAKRAPLPKPKHNQ